MSLISKIITPQAKRKIRKLLSFRFKSKLKKEFTIISNNCWGGIVYDRLGKQYTSPTIGLLFQPDDYISFLENLKHYLKIEPLLDAQQQRKDSKHLGLFHAYIGDLSFFFIHYSSGLEGIEKWNRRKKRICWDNIVVKFSDPIMDNEEKKNELIDRFSRLPFKKLFFTANPILASKYKDISVFLKTKKYVDGFDCNGEELKIVKKQYKLRHLIELINK